LKNKSNKIDLIWKKNPTTIFIQLLRIEKLKKKTNIMKKKEKKEKSYLNVIASEAEKIKKTNS
jgi:hypothetical protein